MARRILVLEPEPICSRFFSFALCKAGFSMLEAKTGEDAIRLCIEHNGSVHLLIADVTIPDCAAIATGQMLREVWPKLGVLFTSTAPMEYWPELERTRAGSIGGALFLLKPFEPAELRRKIVMLVGSSYIPEVGGFADPLTIRGCGEAMHLFEVYMGALTAFHEVRDRDFDKRLAFATLGKARSRYWKHVQMHGCREAVMSDDTGARPL